MCKAVFLRASKALGRGVVIALVTAIFWRSSAAQTPTVEPIAAQPQRAISTATLTASSISTTSGPLAILVRNPDVTPGMPPFALTDQNGVIQRYIEPAGAVNLESHLGQTVRVRHDTGHILLSSQLEFTEPGRAALATHDGRENELPAIHTAEFEVVGLGTGPFPSGSAVAPLGVAAEEIAVPGDNQPIWLDEMESSGSMASSGCNCPQCQAARGGALAPAYPQWAGQPGAQPCSGDGPFGWDCGVCDALFGEDCSRCGPSCGGYCGDCGTTCGSTCDETCGGDPWTCVRPGIIGMAEILFLRGYDSDPDSVSSKKHETGSRYELGYMNRSGRTWRVRYFEFEHPNYDGDRNLELEYWDLEYAGRFTLGRNWRGELSGGLRWSQVDDHGDNRYDHPLGPEMGIQLRSLCCGNLEAYGIARQSFQFGREERSGFYGTFAISEMQLGLEYQTCVCGGTGFGRAFIEGQSWRGVEDNNSEDVGLFGFGFALGLTR